MNTILSIERTAFTIGTLEVQWYGLLITIGMILALCIAMLHMKQIGHRPDEAIELFLWVVPLGVVFARLLYVFVRPSEYFYHWTSFDDFINMIAIWEGGLTIIGGIIGGCLGIVIYSIIHRSTISLGQSLDIVGIPVIFAQVIGRVGNYINQEAFGVAITKASMQHFPIAIFITDPSGVAESHYAEVMDLINSNGGGYWFAATFFYELAWNFLGFIILTIIFKKNRKMPGLIAPVYIAWECLIRALLEYIRLDAVPITQILCWTMLPIVIILGACFVWYRLSKVSYLKMKFLTEAGTISKVNITKFDAWNYAFIGKLLMPEKKISKVFNWLYSVNSKKIYEMQIYAHYVRVDKREK